MDKQYHQRNRDRPPGVNLETLISENKVQDTKIEILENKLARLDIQVMSLKSEVMFLIDLIRKDVQVPYTSTPG